MKRVLVPVSNVWGIVKSKKIWGAGLVMAVVLVICTGIIPAYASDVTIKNMSAETVIVGIYTRSDYSWDKFPQEFGSRQPIYPAGSYTVSIPSDSRHMCVSYLIGYNADYSKAIVTIGCDGTEGNICYRAVVKMYISMFIRKPTDFISKRIENRRAI